MKSERSHLATIYFLTMLAGPGTMDFLDLLVIFVVFVTGTISQCTLHRSAGWYRIQLRGQH